MSLDPKCLGALLEILVSLVILQFNLSCNSKDFFISEEVLI